MSKERDLSVLSYIVQRPEDFFEYKDKLRSFHFDYRPAKEIFPILFAVYDKHGKMPTQTELEWKLQNSKSFQDAPVVSQSSVLKVIEELYNTPATEATGGMIAEFIIYKELETISEGIDESLRGGEYLKVIDDYKEQLESLGLLASTANTEDVVFPFSETFTTAFPDLISEIAGGDVIPTPFTKYNQKSRGGVYRGDSTIVMGSTNIGKTTALVSLGVGWSQAGYRVIYYSIDSAQDEMLERLYVRAANRGLSDEYSYESLAIDVANRMEDNRNFILRHFPAGQATPQDIFRDYHKVRGKLGKLTGCDKVDIVLIDYGDLLISKRQYEAKRHELAGIFTDFAGFAQKEKVHLISATQVNRGGLKKSIITLDDISEAYGKAQPAANVWALCQTDAEYHQGKFRMGVIKSRRGPKNYLIPMTIRYDTQLIAQDLDYDDVFWITRDTDKVTTEHKKPDPIKVLDALAKVGKELATMKENKAVQGDTDGETISSRVVGGG